MASQDAAAPQDALPLVDMNGRRHSEAILRHWSPALLKALGVHRIDGRVEAGKCE